MMTVPSLVIHVMMVGDWSDADAEEDDEPDGVGVVLVADEAVVTVGVVLADPPAEFDSVVFMMAWILRNLTK